MAKSKKQNQSKIRREARSQMSGALAQRLERAFKRYDLSETDFARLMTRKKLGVYGTWTSCKAKLANLRNGKNQSDEFVSNVHNLLEKIKNDPFVVDRALNGKRQGFRGFTIGQSVESRDRYLSADPDNKGRLFVRRHLRKAMKNNS